MDTDLDLAQLRAFRAAVRAGSISAAALATRTPKSTVAKRIADLEASLGLRLIERTTRSFRVTHEGQVLAARAERLLSEAEDIRRALTGREGGLRGPLRIAVPPLMGIRYAGASLARFRERHPGITVECHFLDRPPDLLEEGFDAAIRLGPIDEGGLVARALRDTRSWVVAAPGAAWLDRVREPGDLAAVPTVGHLGSWAGPWALVAPGGRGTAVPVTPGLSLGSPLAVRDAAVAGAGAAIISQLLAEEEIAGGRLVRLLPDWTTPPRPILFVTPATRTTTARLAALIDHFAAELA